MAALKILDTDVFIDHFRGLAAATAYIQGLPVAQHHALVCRACVAGGRTVISARISCKS